MKFDELTIGTRVSLRVDRADIDAGKFQQSNALECPLAQALKRLVPDADSVSCYEFATVSKGDKLVTLKPDDRNWETNPLRVYARHFDDTGEAEPTIIELTVTHIVTI